MHERDSSLQHTVVRMGSTGSRKVMMQPAHRNISFATASGLADLMRIGISMEIRGNRVREIRNRLTVLERPHERCLFLPNRNNDVVASLAETLWVLAGRNDVGWLSAYLPRAPEFSDDGLTWRGAYGPRLRNWNGVDQLAESRRLLLEDPLTRRAVMSLYDPDRDFIESRDIPCNNWLHWLIREGRLHLTIAVRSNDIVWGFSGVNSFEWSVLQQMMAFWVGAKMGDATYLATSFHLYSRHENRARRIIDGFNGVTCYDFGLATPAFSTPFDQLDEVLAAWFSYEAELRNDPEREVEAESLLDDSLLAVSLRIMRIHHGAKRRWSAGRIAEELGRLPHCDLTAAAYELYGRRHPQVIENIPNPQIARFMAAYRGIDSHTEGIIGGAQLIEAIKRLHARKNAAYGTAWKKRGELTSILANIARKVDRLEQYALTEIEIADESVFDTTVDLFVYLLKYRLFLLELVPPEGLPPKFANRRVSLSDDPEAFDASVDHQAETVRPTRTAEAAAREIVTSFGRLHALAESAAPVMQRLAAVEEAASLAYELALALANERPHLVRMLVS